MHFPGDIKTKADFLLFRHDFQADLRKNPAQWENRTLPDFLEALTAFTAGLDGYYHIRGQAEPPAISWDAFATILQAASIYE